MRKAGERFFRRRFIHVLDRSHSTDFARYIAGKSLKIRHFGSLSAAPSAPMDQ
jgi:hypothetical protein